MAEEALKQLEEQLNCSICLDTYTDPKLLQCFHVYCRQCLVPLVDRDQQGQLGLTCPTCRQVTPILDRGVAGLQPAFHIHRLVEVQDSVKKIPNQAVVPEGAVGRVTTNPPSNDLLGHCFEHPGEELKLFCETCGELVCYKCCLKGGRHQSHEYDEVVDAFERYKKEITSSLEPMEKQVTVLKKVLEDLVSHCELISSQRAATEEEMHITFCQVREVLDAREAQLVERLGQITDAKLKDLAVQKDQIETTLAQLCSRLHFMRESLDIGNRRDALMMKSNTIKQVKKLRSPLQPELLKPNAEADIVFSTSMDITTMCRNYGCVLLAKQLPDPSKCYLTVSQELKVTEVGGMFKAIIHAIDFEGNPCEVPIKSLECDVESKIVGKTRCCSVERRGESLYDIRYRPTVKGRHQLQIKAEGHHITGSPFSFSVRLPVEKLGTPIQTFYLTVKPWGVAINQFGEAVVTEWGEGCVSVLNPNGVVLRSFGACGSGQGEFQYPLGVSIDSEGNILVTDSLRVQKFTAEGRLLAETRGCEHSQFVHPTGIAFNPINKMVYVADRDRYCVQILNSDLTFSSVFGSKGSGKGQFSSPYGVACDSAGKVYVADKRNCCVQMFTAEGKFLRVFGRPGRNRGELDWPTGVAIDAHHTVYVSESRNCRVSLFSSEGQFVTSFGRKGMGPGEFVCPSGLAVDRSGVVYVCDCRNDCVQMF